MGYTSLVPMHAHFLFSLSNKKFMLLKPWITYARLISKASNTYSYLEIGLSISSSRTHRPPSETLGLVELILNTRARFAATYQGAILIVIVTGMTIGNTALCITHDTLRFSPDGLDNSLKLSACECMNSQGTKCCSGRPG